MNPFHNLVALRTTPRLRSLLLVLLLALSPFAPVQAEKVTVNFREADIRSVVESVAEITGRSFIVDPRVQGKVTIVSPNPLASEVLYEVLLSTLQVHGFQAVEDGAVTRIVPATSSFQIAGGEAGNRIETAVLKTHYVKPSELLGTLKPMVSKGALIQAHDASNHLIVTDTSSQIERIRQVLKDVDNQEDSGVEIIQLDHIAAGEALHIAGQLKRFRNSELSIVEDIYNNRLIVSGSPVARRDLRQVLGELDVPSGAGGSLEVVRLNFSQAETMKQMLENLLGAGLLRRQASGDGEAADPNWKIEADEDNNALVIAASPAVVGELKQVVRKLDVPRKQVLIEAIVAEISEEQAKRLTVQLAAAGKEGGAIINFNELIPALAGLGLAEDLEPEDLQNLPLGSGLTGGGASWDEDSNRGFGLLLQALKNDANTNILSTPSVVTLDNKEAAISVGQEVPFITGRFESNNNSINNPFQTIEREEVGVKLRVTPQINDSEVVRLAIVQETSNLLSSAAQAGTADVVTAKRIIDTNVMVGNGEFLVLGGLIDESFSADNSKVPLLGDLPLLGQLFRSRSRDSSQSVLMVFIRPTILDAREGSEDVTKRKYDYLRRRQLDFRESYDTDSRLPPLPEKLEDVNRENR